jgi:hypothetical protein
VAVDSEALLDAQMRLDDVNLRIKFTSLYGTAAELRIVQAQRDLIENEIGWLEGGQGSADTTDTPKGERP